MKLLILASAAVLLPLVGLTNEAFSQASVQVGTVTVHLEVGAVEHDFKPDEAFGFALDGLEHGDVDRVYTPFNISKIRDAGYRRASYRLRTELGIEAWHWNPRGRWSDPAHRRGYWTSSDQLELPIEISNGYKLPRRGNTIDQAGDDGYSRLDDGDKTTFWKSNPYLDEYYVGDDPRNIPQWVLVDLEVPTSVDAIRIAWGVPYARNIEVQYWLGAVSEDGIPIYGAWLDFPRSRFSQVGGDETVRVADLPLTVRFVRILLRNSSHSAPPGSTDVRDRLGFAIRELYVGTANRSGAFRDEVKHAASHRQSITIASSTDPWHKAEDLDSNVEQPGVDRLFQSGISNNLPIMLPFGVLYDTPENALALQRYTRARGYPVKQLELGEEPDGQRVSPEHFAALYLEFAKALHNVDAALMIGGPSFQDSIVNVWSEADGDTGFVHRLLRFLAARGATSELGFLSFEDYPFDDLCQQAARQLLSAPSQLDAAIAALNQAGLPSSVPRIIAEYGFSAYAGETLVQMPSALLNNDIVGQFLTLGGSAAYYYGAEPNIPINEHRSCAGYGNMMLYEADQSGRAKWPMPGFFGAQLLTKQWAMPGNQIHHLYSATTDAFDAMGRQIVTAYPVFRPDGKWAVMLINKDPEKSYRVTLAFEGGKSDTTLASFSGTVEVYQYGTEQYAWVASRDQGHPIKSDPPRHERIRGDNPIFLPAYSITVVEGVVGPAPA